MGTKSKVLSKMINSSVHGIETGRPILFFNTANVEMVFRVLNDEVFSSCCPELLKTEHGWTAMETDRTNPQRSPPGSSVHGILQARIQEWVTFPFSRGSS